MSQNTIGQFLAALRKANGMTQQEVADRLNVSNKAVSRWERDECSPDLSAIPVLAELFGVTCDELLKGKRIHPALTAEAAEKKEPKVEKQIKHLIRKALSSFKIMSYIALALAMVGLICMFGISYGFYRPVIGFAIMLLFELAAAVIELIAVTRAKEHCRENELFEIADETQVFSFNKQLASVSFFTFFAILSTILLSFPLVLVRSKWMYSVLTFGTYTVLFLGGIVLFLILLYFKCKEPYFRWISGTAPQSRSNEPVFKVRCRLNFIQLGLLVVFGILLFLSTYASRDVSLGILGILLFPLGMLLVFCIFLFKHKELRKELLLPGIRNLLLIPTALLLPNTHYTARTYSHDNLLLVQHDVWRYEVFLYAALYALIIFVIFELLEHGRKKRTQN